MPLVVECVFWWLVFKFFYIFFQLPTEFWFNGILLYNYSFPGFFEVVGANGNPEVRFLAMFQCSITSFAFSVFSFLVCFQVFNNL